MTHKSIRTLFDEYHDAQTQLMSLYQQGRIDSRELSRIAEVSGDVRRVIREGTNQVLQIMREATA